ncbi:MAG TPA: hypothetical protein VJB57_04120 [Dehalococcoidia bacterium]|nr:hypothetical protein [Dehalococcoidia bacterium]
MTNHTTNSKTAKPKPEAKAFDRSDIDRLLARSAVARSAASTGQGGQDGQNRLARMEARNRAANARGQVATSRPAPPSSHYVSPPPPDIRTVDEIEASIAEVEVQLAETEAQLAANLEDRRAYRQRRYDADAELAAVRARLPVDRVVAYGGRPDLPEAVFLKPGAAPILAIAEEHWRQVLLEGNRLRDEQRSLEMQLGGVLRIKLNDERMALRRERARLATVDAFLNPPPARPAKRDLTPKEEAIVAEAQQGSGMVIVDRGDGHELQFCATASTNPRELGSKQVDAAAWVKAHPEARIVRAKPALSTEYRPTAIEEELEAQAAGAA